MVWYVNGKNWEQCFALLPVRVSKLDKNGLFPTLGEATYHEWQANGYQWVWLTHYWRRLYITNGAECSYVRVPKEASLFYDWARRHAKRLNSWEV